ncbi:MAG: lysine--tRNA ligase [Acidimicrobiia bacterium]
MSDRQEQSAGGRARLEGDPLTAARLAKVEAMRQQGMDPYPATFERDATAAEIAEAWGHLGPGESTGKRVTVAGRLVGRRQIGKLSFGVLQDWSGHIQLFAERQALGERYEDFLALDVGDWIGAGGEVMTTRRNELSVLVDDFTLLAKSLRPLPEKWHGLQDVEKRYRRRHLDLIVNEEARRDLLLRSATVGALRDAFERRGFVEVETPMLQITPGGALARPFATHHNALGVDMFLRVAPELFLKRLVVGGVERVFEINRSFRNEGVSPRHNPEFTMLEAYQAYADYFDMMTLTQEVVAETAQAVLGVTEVTYQGRPLQFGPPWRRVRHIESVAEGTGVDFEFSMPFEEAQRRAAGLGVEVNPAWGIGKIISEVFEKVVEPEIWEPTVVMDYPKEVSPLARTHRDHPDLAERFEAIIAGREIANAFSEINDPLEQRRRFEAQAAARAKGVEEAHPLDEDYLLALEYGMPPTGGLGIGVDRLVMLFADKASIRDVILFPALKPESHE